MSAPGVFARDVDDARLLLEVLLAQPVPQNDARALRVGLVRRTYWENIDPQVEAACRTTLGAAAFPTTELVIPFAPLAAPAGVVRVGAEFSAIIPNAVLPDLDPVTRGLLQYGVLQPARRMVRAARVRARLRLALTEAFATCDLLAWPTNPAPAPPIDAPVLQLPAGPELADSANVRQAILANITGIPGISIPAGITDDGLPIGLQLLAPWGHESRLLDAAQRIQQAANPRLADLQPPLPPPRPTSTH